ncbi:MAG: hypothetical protein IJX79_02975 [Clostridia bacterium]|nr:hypothetical protein [Clostridia bacterium]
MTYKEKIDYLKSYKANLALLRRLESREKFFRLSDAEKKEKNEALWQTEKVAEEISLVASPVLRQVLREKYINGATFSALGDTFGYSTRHIQRLHKVAVEEFEVL